MEYELRNKDIAGLVGVVDFIIELVLNETDPNNPSGATEGIIELRRTQIPYLFRAFGRAITDMVFGSVIRDTAGNYVRTIGLTAMPVLEGIVPLTLKVDAKPKGRFDANDWSLEPLFKPFREMKFEPNSVIAQSDILYEPRYVKSVSNWRDYALRNKASLDTDVRSLWVDNYKGPKELIADIARKERTIDQLYLAVQELGNNDVASYTLKTGYGKPYMTGVSNRAISEHRPYSEFMRLTAAPGAIRDIPSISIKNGELNIAKDMDAIDISSVSLSSDVYGGPLDFLLYWLGYLSFFLTVFSARVSKLPYRVSLPVLSKLNPLHDKNYTLSVLTKVKANLYEMDFKGIESIMVVAGDMFEGDIRLNIT